MEDMLSGGGLKNLKLDLTGLSPEQKQIIEAIQFQQSDRFLQLKGNTSFDLNFAIQPEGITPLLLAVSSNSLLMV